MSGSTQSPSFAINLFRTGEEGSSFRVQNTPNQFQRPHLVDRGSEFTVQADLVNVIHGHFSPGGNPATLIITDFRFISHDSARKFREATIELLFAKSFDPKSDSFHDPEVVRIAPAGRTSIDITKEEHNNKQTINIAGEAGLFGKVGGGFTQEFSKVSKREYGKCVNGVIRIEGRNYGAKNQARWSLFENPNCDDGIPSLLRSAILIKRNDDKGFAATIKIKAKVDRLHSMHSTLENLLGRTRKVDPVYFDPLLEPMGDVPIGMDIENLSEYKLAELVVIESIVPK